VRFPAYSIFIIGTDIRNANNELLTRVELTEMDHGLEMVINDGQHLPGTVHVQVFEDTDFRFLYLYNENSGRYELISGGVHGENLFSVAYGGRCLLTSSRISNANVNWVLIGVIVAVFTIGGGVAYIAVKKKHWFW